MVEELTKKNDKVVGVVMMVIQVSGFSLRRSSQEMRFIEVNRAGKRYVPVRTDLMRLGGFGSNFLVCDQSKC